MGWFIQEIAPLPTESHRDASRQSFQQGTLERLPRNDIRCYCEMKDWVQSGWGGVVPASTWACQASSVSRPEEGTVNS